MIFYNKLALNISYAFCWLLLTETSLLQYVYFRHCCLANLCYIYVHLSFYRSVTIFMPSQTLTAPLALQGVTQ